MWYCNKCDRKHLIQSVEDLWQLGRLHFYSPWSNTWRRLWKTLKHRQRQPSKSSAGRESPQICSECMASIPPSECQAVVPGKNRKQNVKPDFRLFCLHLAPLSFSCEWIETGSYNVSNCTLVFSRCFPKSVLPFKIIKQSPTLNVDTKGLFFCSFKNTKRLSSCWGKEEKLSSDKKFEEKCLFSLTLCMSVSKINLCLSQVISYQSYCNYKLKLNKSTLVLD